MWFVMLRVTAFVLLLQLSQVTPGLSCTFTKFNGALLKNVTVAFSNAGTIFTFEQCFKQCFETPGCSNFIYDRKYYICTVLAPGERKQIRYPYGESEIYQFDRDVFDTSCPTVKQWMAQQTNVAA